MSASASRPQVSASWRVRVAASQGWACGLCGATLTAAFETDHVIPLYKGGAHRIDNLMSLCRECHAQKTRRDADDDRRPFLLCNRCGATVSPHFAHGGCSGAQQ